MPASVSCLIVDHMHPSILPLLEQIGVRASYQPDLTPGEIPEALADYEGLIVRSKLTITPAVLQNADQLRFIARAGAGVDNIDDRVVSAGKVTILNAPEGNSDAVGEFGVGALLALLRNIARADQQVRQGEWLREPNRGEELGGKTVAIIGLGHMGQAMARRLAGFGCRVLAHDTSPDGKDQTHARLTDLSEIYDLADVVSLHIPLNDQNRHHAGEAFFSSFRKNVWFLNMARGEVTDHGALVRYLQNGKVKGAALDVLENEKLATLTETQRGHLAYLTQAPNVVLTPHIAGWTHESYARINEVLVQKIRVFLSR